jgi:glycolate oxidase FAD binding subunit
MALAMGTPCDVSGAAHLPGAVAQRTVGQASGSRSVTAFRLEGVPASITHRRNVLEAQLKPSGSIVRLGAADSRALWQQVRDVTPFAAETDDRPLWRISTAPALGAELASRIASKTDAELLYDWAGGLIWLALPRLDDAGARVVRAAVTACGGHATLIRAPAAVRAAVAVFEPQEPVLAALTRRVKESFDPNGMLNPGRMWAGV